MDRGWLQGCVGLCRDVYGVCMWYVGRCRDAPGYIGMVMNV